MRNGCVVAKHLLDRSGDLAGGRAQGGELFGMAEQGDDAVADEAGGRVVPRDDQLEDRREQFLLIEVFVAVTRADQGTDEVIARSVELRLDEQGQHFDHRV